jgi:serine/threonine protein kinase/tetratricopeptide (TPR) repeat protein
VNAHTRWRRISELFEAALDLPEGERTDWLRRQDLTDPTVLTTVEKMLEAHENAEGILDRPIVGLPDGDLVKEDPGPKDLARLLDEALDGRYRIVRELGRGGMAVVFLAWERKHDRLVVLKVMRPGMAERFSADRFAREVRLAARLAHPHIVALIDSGQVEGFAYYVMPYIEGETLRSVLRRDSPVSVKEALPLLRDVARALAHAHAQGVVHRDLKPANVLVAGHHAYLLDFGVAKSFEADEGDDPLTRTGDAIGTPRYMAPEQLAGMSDTNHRVDLYAWGQLAHEMLLGQVRELEPSDLEGEPVAPKVAGRLAVERPDVSAELADLVGRCLEVRPDSRSVSADEILAVLGGVQSGSRSSRARLARSGRGRRALARYLPGFAAGAVVITAAVFALTHEPREEVATDQKRLTPAGVDNSVLASPIAVSAFRNETGDPTLDVVGRLVGDWISEGLVHAGVGPVVPWPSSLEAAEAAEKTAGAEDRLDPVSALAEGTGARTIVTGSYYATTGKRLSFRAEVVDARDGSVVSATETVSAPRDSLESAIFALRERVMGSVALASDVRLAAAASRALRPPTFAAYRAFDRGLGLYLRQEYTLAVPELLGAWELDPEFYDAPLLAATNLVNIGTTSDRVRADSLLDVLREHRSSFSELQDLRWQYLRSLLDSDGSAALQAALRAAAITSASRTSYNAARAAVSVGRPDLAIEFLEAMDPDSGPLREWLHYWTVLAHARHLVGDFDGELTATRSMQERFPDRRIGSVLEARALAAAGRTAELDSLLNRLEGLSPSAYWSQGAAMVVAGEELRAHGYDSEGEAMLLRGQAWLQARLREAPGFRQHRYWLGSVAYDLGEYDTAGHVFADLFADYPDRATYRGMLALSLARTDEAGRAERLLDEGFEYALGDRTALLARLSAIGGDPARAVSLLGVALDQGLEGLAWLHASAWPDLELMRSDPRFGAVASGMRGQTSPE